MHPPKRQPTWTAIAAAALTTTLLAACGGGNAQLHRGQCQRRDGRVNITAQTDTALTRALAASPADVFAGADATRASANQRRQRQLLGPGRLRHLPELGYAYTLPHAPGLGGPKDLHHRCWTPSARCLSGRVSIGFRNAMASTPADGRSAEPTRLQRAGWRCRVQAPRSRH